MKIIMFASLFISVLGVSMCSLNASTTANQEVQGQQRYQPTPIKAITTSPEQQIDIPESGKVRVIRKGGEFCEKYILNRIKSEAAEGALIGKLDDAELNGSKIQSKVREWINKEVHADTFKGFELRNKNTSVILISGNVAGATGIASNFRNWFIQINGKVVRFRSLSENPQLIFWARDDSLNFYSVDYSADFNGDWDNVTFDVSEYKVNGQGESELMNVERKLKCR
jgi:hypothetical protein